MRRCVPFASEGAIVSDRNGNNRRFFTRDGTRGSRRIVPGRIDDSINYAERRLTNGSWRYRFYGVAFRADGGWNSNSNNVSINICVAAASGHSLSSENRANKSIQ
ncbi:hypothetical protein GWI33_000445 [Rhynchophorus ferrugineus]|uniref:Uncharacterized protein n=1 Tax=Rhynchophorus ferrugineus TaxID=354439 RepID=A0A834HNY6_RHYFE|nr:hypothetical protein GWI33_000445 [Rhynchophorus ferrugineus]